MTVKVRAFFSDVHRTNMSAVSAVSAVSAGWTLDPQTRGFSSTAEDAIGFFHSGSSGGNRTVFAFPVRL